MSHRSWSCSSRVFSRCIRLAFSFIRASTWVRMFFSCWSMLMPFSSWNNSSNLKICSSILITTTVLKISDCALSGKLKYFHCFNLKYRKLKFQVERLHFCPTCLNAAYEPFFQWFFLLDHHIQQALVRKDEEIMRLTNCVAIIQHYQVNQVSSLQPIWYT